MQTDGVLSRQAVFVRRCLDVLVQQIEHHLQARVGDAITIGAVVFSYQHNIILKTSAADILISRIMEE